jgi:hypothetical protein
MVCLSMQNLLLIQQMALSCPDDGLGTIAHIQFFVEAAGMGLNGVEADEHGIGDLAVGTAVCQMA